MSTDTAYTTRTEQALAAYLAGMDRRRELVPGVSAELVKQFVRFGDVERAFVALHEHLDGPGKCLLNPEYEQGKPEAPARKVLRRMPLAPAAADDLYDSAGWAARYAGYSEGEAAARAWQEIQRPEHNDRLANPPGPTVAQRRLFEAFECLRVAGYVRPGVDAFKLARHPDWAAAAQGSKRQAVALLAKRLSMPHFAANLTHDGEPVQVHHQDIMDVGDWSDEAGRSEARRHAAYGRL